MNVRVEPCPRCAVERLCRVVGTVVVDGCRMLLLACPAPVCGLVWATEPDPRPVPVAA